MIRFNIPDLKAKAKCYLIRAADKAKAKAAKEARDEKGPALDQDVAEEASKDIN